jgi:N-acetyltransferase
MEYVPSSIEDRKLHQKYHRQNSEGYDVGDVFVDQTLKPRRMRGLKSGDYVIMVDAFDLHHRKRRAHAALEIVQRELGAVEIPHNDIWKSQPDDLSHRESKYRSYMYIRGTKCIGYLLVEQLDKAYAVLNSAASTDTTTAAAGDKEEKSAKKISALAALRARKEQLAQELADCASQPLKCADVDSPAVMGVSRIWTSPVHRKQNIATALLDAAVKFHNEFAEMSRNLPPPTSDLSPELKETVVPPYKRPNIVRRDQVAFSQPTESGARLARKWIGKAYGWLVYL